MPIDFNKIKIDLDQEITIESSSTNKDLEELEAISSKLHNVLHKGYYTFNDWTSNFIEDIFRLDKRLLTAAQIEKLNEIYDKYVEGR